MTTPAVAQDGSNEATQTAKRSGAWNLALFIGGVVATAGGTWFVKDTLDAASFAVEVLSIRQVEAKTAQFNMLALTSISEFFDNQDELRGYQVEIAQSDIERLSEIQDRRRKEGNGAGKDEIDNLSKGERDPEKGKLGETLQMMLAIDKLRKKAVEFDILKVAKAVERAEKYLDRSHSARKSLRAFLLAVASKAIVEKAQLVKEFDEIDKDELLKRSTPVRPATEEPLSSWALALTKTLANLEVAHSVISGTLPTLKADLETAGKLVEGSRRFSISLVAHNRGNKPGSMLPTGRLHIEKDGKHQLIFPIRSALDRDKLVVAPSSFQVFTFETGPLVAGQIEETIARSADLESEAYVRVLDGRLTVVTSQRRSFYRFADPERRYKELLDRK